MAWLIFKVVVAIICTIVFNHEQHNKKDIRNSPQYWNKEMPMFLDSIYNDSIYYGEFPNNIFNNN